jgi:hypothetical protein
LHVGFPIKEELEEHSLNIKEHSLNLFLTHAVPLNHLIQINGAVSLLVQAGITCFEYILLQLSRIRDYVACKEVYLKVYKGLILITLHKHFPRVS